MISLQERPGMPTGNNNKKNKMRLKDTNSSRCIFAIQKALQMSALSRKIII